MTALDTRLAARRNKLSPIQEPKGPAIRTTSKSSAVKTPLRPSSSQRKASDDSLPRSNMRTRAQTRAQTRTQALAQTQTQTQAPDGGDNKMRKGARQGGYKQPRGKKQVRKGTLDSPPQNSVQKGAATQQDSTQLKPPNELSTQNLELWDMMNNHPPNARRIPSQQPTETNETSKATRSTNTIAQYRFTNLAAVEVYVHVDLPQEVGDAIHKIIRATPSEERRIHLNAVAQAFHKGCLRSVRASGGEDDSVRHLQIALESIEPKYLRLFGKADWEVDLKPNGLPDRNYYSFLNHMPSTSLTADVTPNPMPPPACPTIKNDVHVKTPRPDLTIGLALDAIIAALSSADYGGGQAKKFLNGLQTKMVSRGPSGTWEPALLSVPAKRASDLTFPFAVVEGKAYSTGRQLFEAQNQAAVSGACGIKLQLCLNDLVYRKANEAKDSRIAGSVNKEPALFFSICTEGPVHELWAHWTTLEGDERKFNMTLIKTCNGALLEGIEDFIIAMDNILDWGTSRFFNSVADRLKIVAGAVVVP